MFPIFVLICLPFWTIATCPTNEACIQRLKEVVAGPKRFWFGEQRRAQCHHRGVVSVDCFGAAHLSSFHSIGSRLFRVPTFHSAYLRNIAIFPRITYRPTEGHYRACEHDYFVEGSQDAIEVHVDMPPATPFSIRNRPEIEWTGMQYDDEYLMIMSDVGAGTLNFAVMDFPSRPKYLHEYEPSDNFRSLPNPLVLLIFKKPPGNVTMGDDEYFDLVKFMTDNGLEDSLVGMNVVVVGSDPFAIERQRLRATADNCHSLLQQRLLLNPPANAPLLKTLSTDGLAQWISIAFNQPALSASVCCSNVRQNASRVFLDPLGDISISALSVVEPPSFTSLRMAQTPFLNYHRQTRTYVALMNDLFSLALVDAVNGNLHWLVTDIPASELATDRPKGITKADYLPPVPTDPVTCKTFVFALLYQPSSLMKLDQFCEQNCAERKEFKLESFAQRHGLRIVALNWMKSCFDLPYAFHVLSTSNSSRQSHLGEKSSFARATVDAAYRTCAAFDAAPHRRCSLALISSLNTWNWAPLLFIFFALFQ